MSPLVNDVHSRLNATHVARVVRPPTIEEVVGAVRAAADEDRSIAICAGRHAIGGQQFAAGAIQLDMNALDRVLEFDPVAGEAEGEAGIQLPALVAWLNAAQSNTSRQYAIAQNLTGADRLGLGSALAADIHGRDLRLPPLVDQAVAYLIVDPAGMVRRWSRQENAELSELAIGAIGPFGPMASVRLQFAPRR